MHNNVDTDQLDLLCVCVYLMCQLMPTSMSRARELRAGVYRAKWLLRSAVRLQLAQHSPRPPR